MKKIIVLIIIILGVSKFIYAQELIENGFVFIEGKYIESPYQVTVKDFTVYINNNVIVQSVKYPQFDLRVFTDPVIPKGITKDMGLSAIDSFRDSTNRSIILKRLSYFFQKFPETIANEKASEFLKTLPFIKKFKIYDDGHINLEDYYDKTRNVLINHYMPPAPPTLQECLDAVNLAKKHYEDYLKDGDCFMFNKGVEIHLTGSKAARILSLLVKTLSDPSISIERKKDVLDHCGVIPKRSDRSEKFIKDFKPNDQLYFKINKHIEFIKIKYSKDIL